VLRQCCWEAHASQRQRGLGGHLVNLRQVQLEPWDDPGTCTVRDTCKAPTK
jgi:hypothetical protein